MTNNDERTPLLTNNQGETTYNGINSQGSENGTAQKNDGDIKSVRSMLIFLAAASSGILLAALDSTIVTSAYARIGSELNQLHRASWIATSYMMTMTAFQPLYGKLSDIFGRKFCLLIAHFIFGIGCLGCALAKNIISLVAARFVSGMGGAGLVTVVVIAISDMVPLRQRGTWQGGANVKF
ncbi:hypothetical protein Clacol_004301 [Clathrus columnatus]|uniref:Major facilitator superfamily (MFS) profile domain-containing protein n=1 Tax=Clathrus columnatus TaxID=1419009 RepID=A0AAV5ADS5_9AGAM|nr:hypothetical protein Clacol_004301 [Clathrus columnatus]